MGAVYDDPGRVRFRARLNVRDEAAERELQSRRIYASRETLGADSQWLSSTNTIFDGTYRRIHGAARKRPKGEERTPVDGERTPISANNNRGGGDDDGGGNRAVVPTPSRRSCYDGDGGGGDDNTGAAGGSNLDNYRDFDSSKGPP